MDVMKARIISDLPAEILANIVKFLPGRCLVKASLVCHLWKDLAQREFNRRKYFVSRVFECHESINSRHLGRVLADIRRQILKFLNEIGIFPAAVVIASSQLLRRTSPNLFLKKLEGNLPTNCIIMGGQDVAGLVGETCFGKPVEIKGLRHRHLSILFIPKVKGVNLGLLNITKEYIRTIDWRREDLFQLFGRTLDHLVGRDIKFMFFISHPRGTSSSLLPYIWGNIKKVFGKQVTIAGGLSSPFAFVNKKLEPSVLVGLAIGGNIEASSIVHIHDDRTQLSEDLAIISALQELPKPPSLHLSACFVARCVNNTAKLFCCRSEDEEVSDFRKAFPELKLFGFHCWGEIGLTPGLNEEYGIKVFASSTVLSILSFS